MPIDTLAQEIDRIARIDGAHPTGIPCLTLFRSSVRTEPMPCIYALGLTVVAQGGKQVTLGDQVIDYGPGQSLLTAVDLPVIGQVTRADLARPFLGLVLTLDARALVQAAAEMALPPLPRDSVPRAISRCATEAPLLDALIRLVRLLCGPHGPYLRHLLAAGTPSHQIARAMAWLKQNFTGDVLIDQLAARVHMSPSTFRQHFRSLTGMSPLQYQKQLRLQEARQLMLSQDLDASSTAARVGYESASQFSRDYSRLFGEPPQRDIRRMRHLSDGGVETLG